MIEVIVHEVLSDHGRHLLKVRHCCCVCSLLQLLIAEDPLVQNAAHELVSHYFLAPQPVVSSKETIDPNLPSLVEGSSLV